MYCSVSYQLRKSLIIKLNESLVVQVQSSITIISYRCKEKHFFSVLYLYCLKLQNYLCVVIKYARIPTVTEGPDLHIE